MNHKIGFAGKIAEIFSYSKLTPVIAVFSILLGVLAVYLTPKEEEPQISVPMIDIHMAAPGFEAAEVEKKVTEPVERAIWGLEGVEYVYSASQAHGSLVTARFKVGEPMESSLLKIHDQIMKLKSELPESVNLPTIKSYSIDDVPFLTLTFSSKEFSSYQLRTLVAPLARELSSTPDLAKVELKGGLRRSIRVIVDPRSLQQKGVSLLSVANALKLNDALLPVGKSWGIDANFSVEVGGRISSVKELEMIPIGQRGGQVVRLSDIAKILDGPEEMTRASFLFTKENVQQPENAVSITFAKRKGTNVVELALQLLNRAKSFSKNLPQSVTMSEVRNYGSTANEKSIELIEHLLIATLSVAALIALIMGLRASVVVAIAIPVTLALTLAIYYFLGYTLNRITLFALIFSIGILVDDAIVVVENIERHLQEKPELGIFKSTINAVSEVGNPTILATFTVIAAILPMAFVKGMMGPYMKPIPVGASLAMIFSLLIAFVVTPWASVRILKHEHLKKSENHENSESKLDRLYRKFMEGLLTHRRKSISFGIMTALLFFLSLSFLYFKFVKVKMLPFDNKNEFQVVVDFPPETPLLKSIEWAKELAGEMMVNPEVLKVQVFAGESAPFSFSGMVKHAYLRQSENQVDFQIVLTGKNERKVSSHEIIESLRPVVTSFGLKHNAVTKVLEIPPGPPVLATMVAEVYGPSREAREKITGEIEKIFRDEKSVVDLDTTNRELRKRKIYQFDRVQGGYLGADSVSLAKLGGLVFSENRIALLNESTHPEEIGVDLSIRNEVRSSEQPFIGQTIPSFESGSVNANSLLKKPTIESNPVLYRKNLKPVSYVMSELSGSEEAPVYGILKLSPKIKYPTQTAEVPWNTEKPIVKWDGEWFITFEVFRDLGGAFAIVILLIYVLVLGWFQSYLVPLVIMAPIPISLIGILPGHAIMGAYFTATSMIGFIAGAGIIVRNSIILVDFIEHQIKSGMAVKEAVISAGVLRFRPMLLTAAAVVVGSSVMLTDPIFQGLAVSLIFGEIAATVLSRFSVPILYYWFLGEQRKEQLHEN
jgi:multidrug efflux pump subunit AcrB